MTEAAKNDGESDLKVPSFPQDMTIDEFMTRIRESWPPREGSKDLVGFILSGIQAYPHSARLWCWLGDAIVLAQRYPKEFEYSEIECYQNALLADPLCADAYEGIAFALDILDAPDVEMYFRSAIECDSGPDSYIGLANYYNDRGRASEATAVLRESIEGYESSIQKLRDALKKIQ